MCEVAWEEDENLSEYKHYTAKMGVVMLMIEGRIDGPVFNGLIYLDDGNGYAEISALPYWNKTISEIKVELYARARQLFRIALQDISGPRG